MKTKFITISVSLVFIGHIALALPSEDSCSEKCMSVIQQYMAEANGQKKVERSGPTNEELREWAAVYTNNATILFAAALSYNLNQSIEAALPSFEAAYEASSYDTIIGNMYAGILVMGKQATKAKSVLRELIEHNTYPQNLLPKFTLALLLEQTQDYNEALELLQEQNSFWRARGVQFSPKPNVDYATILMHIGVCQMYLGEHAESIRTLNLAESYWPTAAHIINYQAEAYLKDGQPDKAKEILLFAKDNNRCDESTFYYLGIIVKEADPVLARSYFEQAYEMGQKRLAASSDIGSVYYMMSNIAKELGKEAQAKQYKEEARKLNFTYSAPWKSIQKQRVDPTSANAQPSSQ